MKETKQAAPVSVTSKQRAELMQAIINKRMTPATELTAKTMAQHALTQQADNREKQLLAHPQYNPRRGHKAQMREFGI